MEKEKALNIALFFNKADEKLITDIFQTSSIIQIFKDYSVDEISDKCISYMRELLKTQKTIVS